jgi:hypothetical protein
MDKRTNIKFSLFLTSKIDNCVFMINYQKFTYPSVYIFGYVIHRLNELYFTSKIVWNFHVDIRYRLTRVFQRRIDMDCLVVPNVTLAPTVQYTRSQQTIFNNYKIFFMTTAFLQVRGQHCVGFSIAMLRTRTRWRRWVPAEDFSEQDAKAPTTPQARLTWSL